MNRIHVEDSRKGHNGKASVDLVFENIKRKDRGIYTCSANIDGKEMENKFELIVLSKYKYL